MGLEPSAIFGGKAAEVGGADVWRAMTCLLYWPRRSRIIGRSPDQSVIICGEEQESPDTVVTAGVQEGHCSRYSVIAPTIGVRGLGGDLNDLPLELVLEVWGHVMVAGAERWFSWETSESSHSRGCRGTRRTLQWVCSLSTDDWRAGAWRRPQ